MLQKRMICACWVPHCVLRLEVVTQLFNRYQNDDKMFLKCIVAIDETWIRDVEPELSLNQWRGKGEARRESKIRSSTDETEANGNNGF